MESRKQKNLQIERKKRAQQRTVKGVFILVIAAILAAVAFMVWDNINRRTVLIFGSETIATSDFRLIHMMSGAEDGDEEAREAAFTGLLRTLTVMERAQQHGIFVPQEEMDELMEQAAETREWVASWTGAGALRGTSDSRMAHIMSVGMLVDNPWFPVDFGTLTTLLMDEYLPDFRPEQSAIDEFLEEWAEDIYNAAIEETVQFVAVDEWDDGWTVLARAEAGEPFADLVERYHFPAAGEIESPASLQEFLAHFGAWDHAGELHELEEGEISTVLMLNDDRFVVVQMYERAVNEELRVEIEEETVEIFVNDSRRDAFVEMIDEWVAAVSYSRNERALSRF